MKYAMPFSANNSVLQVLPKSDNASPTSIADSSSINSMEDKELRKKLRNRQSALAARERKKARMLELERQVAELQEINRRAEEENQYLRSRLEVIVRKCMRAGVRVDGEGDFIRNYNFSNQQQTLRVAGVPDYSRVYVRDHQQPASPYGCQRSGEMYNVENSPSYRTTECATNALSQTEASLRSSIKVLGQRQNEILQSMSLNDHVTCQQQQESEINRAYPVKQEYMSTGTEETSAFYSQHLDRFNQVTEIASPVHKRSLNAPGNGAPSFAATRKRQICEVSRLPSIGSMLAPPAAKRPCANTPVTHVVNMPPTLLQRVKEPCKETQGTSFAAEASETEAYPQSIKETRQLSQLETNLVDDFELKDCNLTNSTSPMLLQNDELYSGLSSATRSEKLTILDFQDILDGEISADSPSALSGSDSGISMDDSLDWITENPIFDI